MLPLPWAVKPEAPPVCAAVYVTSLRIAGNASRIAAPVTAAGPALVTTTV